METKAALEALLDKIDWFGWLFTIAVFASIGGEAAMHLWHRQVSKRLEVVLQQENERREARIKYAAAKAGPRHLDAERFLQPLKGKPKGIARIWYKGDDTEAYWFASEIHGLLGTRDFRSAGWTVSEPEPLPAKGSLPPLDKPVDEIASIRYGDLTLRASIFNCNFTDENTAEGALSIALRDGRAAPVGGSVMVMMGERALPANHFVIVVGQKQ